MFEGINRDFNEKQMIKVGNGEKKNQLMII